MKKAIFLLLGLLLGAFCTAVVLGQEKQSAKNPKYDKALATRLGGDKNGMKQYVFVFLKCGKA